MPADFTSSLPDLYRFLEGRLHRVLAYVAPKFSAFVEPRVRGNQNCTVSTPFFAPSKNELSHYQPFATFSILDRTFTVFWRGELRESGLSTITLNSRLGLLVRTFTPSLPVSRIQQPYARACSGRTKSGQNPDTF
jgi:hypothetical protein